MKNKSLWIVTLLTAALWAAYAQQPDILAKIVEGERPALAVASMRGAGGAAPLMDEVNRVLYQDLEGSGLFRMVAKSLYPLEVPQRQEDWIPPVMQSGNPVRQGPWLTDWSQPPVNANFVSIGYGAERDGRLLLYGWLYNVTQPDVANAQVFGKFYFGDLDAAGAQKVAHEFAADILGQFGFESLLGSKVHFVSNRSGAKEIWSMDYDGSNQKQITKYGSISQFPAVSPDGTRLVFTTWASSIPLLQVFSLETGRRLPFLNQEASVNSAAEFTPDGQQIVFSSTADSKSQQIYIANVDGTNWRRLTDSRAIDTEPTVNPKTGRDLVFVSGRGSGLPQIYKMGIDGANVERLTDGEGEAVNPSWHPNGQHIAFAWTRGYAPGNYNIFIMDVATKGYVQLTHGAGRNENPTWASDGRHLVFASNRNGSLQIWTMLADGTQAAQLTSVGVNEKPVWSRK